MITITTEIKSRCFKKSEKRELYETLRKPFKEKMSQTNDAFKEWLDENVLPLVLDPELKELGNKPYCVRKTNRFYLTPAEFGLKEVYKENQEKTYGTSLRFEYYSSTWCAAGSGVYSIPISWEVIKKCPPEIIEQIKYFLYERAKAEYEYSFYGIGTFIRSSSYQYGIFEGLRTWGNLYSKSPELFEKLCKMREFANEESIDPEVKLLNELKSFLGY